jgi:hypothetical protein
MQDFQNYKGNYWLKKIKSNLRLESELVIIPFRKYQNGDTDESEIIDADSFNFSHLFYV